jgi:hypothetical protein
MPTPHEQGGEGGIVSTVKEAAQSVAETAGNLASQARERVQDFASSAAGTASDATGAVGEWASAGANWTGETAKDVGHELTQMIRRYPMPALLIGFGLGFLLARATRR